MWLIPPFIEANSDNPGWGNTIEDCKGGILLGNVEVLERDNTIISWTPGLLKFAMTYYCSQLNLVLTSFGKNLTQVLPFALTTCITYICIHVQSIWCEIMNYELCAKGGIAWVCGGSDEKHHPRLHRWAPQCRHHQPHHPGRNKFENQFITGWCQNQIF